MKKTPDPRVRVALVTVLTVLPAFISGATTYLTTAAKAKEAEAKIYENYGEYVQSQLKRDEALVKAIEPCLRPVALAVSTKMWKKGMLPAPAELSPAADVVLDRIAKSEGWKP